MTQEEKQLLFKDLCARLPYGVKILDVPANVVGDLFLISTTDMVEYEPTDEANDDAGRQTLYNIKPYLRPMSSMTEEEMKMYQTLQDTACSYHYEFGDIVDDVLYFDNDVSLDYLNSIHIDYRGLIPMGLALEATKDMYKTE